MSSPDDLPTLANTSGETSATAGKSTSLRQILARNGMPNAERNVTSTMAAVTYIGLRLRGIAIDIAQKSTNGLLAKDQSSDRNIKLTKLRGFIVELEELELLAVAHREQNVADMSIMYNQHKFNLKTINSSRSHHRDDANSRYCQEELRLAKSAKAEVDLRWAGRAQARGMRESTSDSTSLFLPQSERAQSPSPRSNQELGIAQKSCPLHLGQELKRKGENERSPHEFPSQTKRIKTDDSPSTSSIQRTSSPLHLTSLPHSVLPSRSITSLRSTSLPQLTSMTKATQSQQSAVMLPPTPFQQSTALPPPTPSQQSTAVPPTTSPQQSTAMPPPTLAAQTKSSPTFTSLPQPSPVPHPSPLASMFPPRIVIHPHLSDPNQDSVKRIKTVRLLINGVVDASSYEALITRLDRGLRFDPPTQHLREVSSKVIIVDYEDLEDALGDVKEGEDLLLEIADGNVFDY